MAHLIALATAKPLRFSHIELLRALVVCGCALALISAGHAFPG